jgi:guanylate kinase
MRCSEYRVLAQRQIWSDEVGQLYRLLVVYALRMARLFILTGPSGVGKDSVRDLLMEWRLPVHFVVTATDRAPRQGEVEGKDYHFVTVEEFDRLEREDGLIEHAVVYGQRKGVPRAEVERPLAEGRDVLARVDVQGVATLKRLYPDALVIFLAPPSLKEAERRLDERDTETEGELRLRIETAESEMESMRGADYVVVNRTGELQATAARVRDIIEADGTDRR